MRNERACDVLQQESPASGNLERAPPTMKFQRQQTHVLVRPGVGELYSILQKSCRYWQEMKLRDPEVTQVPEAFVWSS